MSRKTKAPPTGSTTVGPETVETLQRADAMFRAGRFMEAADLYQQVIHHHPKLPDVHNNLGVALKSAGHLKDAVPCFKRAARLKPDYAAAHTNLAGALEALGKVREGLDHRVNAWRLDPSNPEPRGALIRALHRCPYDKPHAGARAALVALQGDGDIDQQALADAAARVWGSHPGIRRALQAAEHNFPDGSPGAGFKPATNFLADGLILHALCWSLIANPFLEALLTRTRAFLLSAAVDGTLSDVKLAWLAALATQARIAEWVWFDSAQEVEDLTTLTERARAGDDTLEHGLIRALYGPLESDPQADALHRQAATLATEDTGPLALLLRRSFRHPAVEAKLAENFRPAAAIEDATSQAVRSQYEDNPYPRWMTLERRPRRTLSEHLRTMLATPTVPAFTGSTLRILVAGCGTGRHALQTALRYQNAEVLAIDLSAASLAYAQRMADALEVRNITFAQADLLTLDGYSERFDLIESSGVLHHLAEPMAGWQVLRGLLAPHGLMRLAFYSRRARAPFEEIRAQLPKQGPAIERIRAARRAVMAAPDGHGARQLLRTADFYSASGVRDALLHVQEATVDPLWIANGLDRLDLRFLGFELPDPAILEAYRQRRPDDLSGLDLTGWEAMEIDHSDLFLGMYQFWAQATD